MEIIPIVTYNFGSFMASWKMPKQSFTPDESWYKNRKQEAIQYLKTVNRKEQNMFYPYQSQIQAMSTGHKYLKYA